MSDHDEKTTALGCGLMLALLLVIYLVQLALYQEVHTGTFRCVKTYTITTGGGDSISKITARGPRNPTFSMFPNVTQAVEIAE